MVWRFGKLAAAAAAAAVASGVLGASASANIGAWGAVPTLSPAGPVVTVPYFQDSFTFDGTTYPYVMVGSDPVTSQATTIVPTVIQPLRFVFADGNVSPVGDVVGKVIGSPIFRPASFSSGETQYGDAVRRAMFWKYDEYTNYHVLLAPPVVLPTETLYVPAADGVFLHAGDPSGPPAFGFTVEADTGVVSQSWFDSKFASLLGPRVGPRVLPIVLSRNVALSTDPIPYGSPTTGFHAAWVLPSRGDEEPIQTAIWASYYEPYVVAQLPGILQNTDDLSHEVSEWLHDPFLNNTVPNWASPLPLAAAIYGCRSLLETGDPAADASFEVNGYQLQDEAFLSWFAHQVPSIGINGQYSFTGTLRQPAPTC